MSLLTAERFKTVIAPAATCEADTSSAIESRVSLRRNQRGAVLVLGVFMSIFLVSMVYFLMGIATTLHAREGLQDGADAAVYASAILHARGMNLIAFINLIMAAILCVLIAVRVAQGVCLVGIVIAGLAAYPTGGQSLIAIPPLQQAERQLDQAFKSLEPTVMNLLRGLHAAQRATSVLVPAVATLDSVREVVGEQPAASFGFAVPTTFTLPVEKDEFPVLCGRSGEMMAGLATSPVPNIAGVRTAIEDAVGDLTKSASAYFCGSGGNQAPKFKQRRKQTLPEPPLARACQEQTEAGDERATRTCAEAEREVQEADFDMYGRCAGGDCSLQGAYERTVQAAREQCEPTDKWRPLSVTWQERTTTTEYVFRSGGWVKSAERHHDLRTNQGASPCGRDGTLSETWNRKAHPTGRLHELEPVCVEDVDALPAEGVDGETIEVEQREILHVLRCEAIIEVERDPYKNQKPLNKQENTEPHRVVKGFELGDDIFQIRSIVIGPTPHSENAEKGVGLAAFDTGNDETSDDASASLALDIVDYGSAIAVAQAEYFYDHTGNEAREEWLWNMKWTARLMRVRLPRDNDDKSDQGRAHQGRSRTTAKELGGLTGDGGIEGACRAAGGKKCGGLRKNFEKLAEVLIH